MKRIEKRRNKKTKKLKRLFVELIARLIYYSICSVIGCSAIILFFGTIGAITNLCEQSKIYCICYFIVCGSIITKWILKEVGNNE